MLNIRFQLITYDSLSNSNLKEKKIWKENRIWKIMEIFEFLGFNLDRFNCACFDFNNISHLGGTIYKSLSLIILQTYFRT